MSTRKKNQVTASSGNVFADLGLDDAAELSAKSGLVHKIALLIKERGLTQMQAAALLDIDQPKISNLLRGRLEGFSIERLFRFLNALDQDVEIIIRDKAHKHGEVQVSAA
jgi:predicted XRE-type DNA-binding protein